MTPQHTHFLINCLSTWYHAHTFNINRKCVTSQKRWLDLVLKEPVFRTEQYLVVWFVTATKWTPLVMSYLTAKTRIKTWGLLEPFLGYSVKVQHRRPCGRHHILSVDTKRNNWTESDSANKPSGVLTLAVKLKACLLDHTPNRQPASCSTRMLF